MLPKTGLKLSIKLGSNSCLKLGSKWRGGKGGGPRGSYPDQARFQNLAQLRLAEPGREGDLHNTRRRRIRKRAKASRNSRQASQRDVLCQTAVVKTSRKEWGEEMYSSSSLRWETFTGRTAFASMRRDFY